MIIVMTQEERWMIKYKEVVEFINTNHRNPSRHRIEEHDMLNWLKANRKTMILVKGAAEKGKSQSSRMVLTSEMCSQRTS